MFRWSPSGATMQWYWYGYSLAECPFYFIREIRFSYVRYPVNHRPWCTYGSVDIVSVDEILLQRYVNWLWNNDNTFANFKFYPTNLWKVRVIMFTTLKKKKKKKEIYSFSNVRQWVDTTKSMSFCDVIFNSVVIRMQPKMSQGRFIDESKHLYIMTANIKRIYRK